MRALSVVWWKEVRENLRDRRTMVSTFVLGPLFGPVLFAVLIGFVAKTELDRAEKALELPVIGAEHAPNLMNWLGAQGVEAVDPTAEPEEAVRTREVELVLRIDDEYGKALGEGRPAPLTLIFDQSQTKARASIERVQALLQGYGDMVARQRLLIRDWRAQAFGGASQALMRADMLVDGRFVRDLGMRRLRLFRLEFDAAHVIYAGGLELAADISGRTGMRQAA